jgi:hypothetical protein
MYKHEANSGEPEPLLFCEQGKRYTRMVLQKETLGKERNRGDRENRKHTKGLGQRPV